VSLSSLTSLTSVVPNRGLSRRGLLALAAGVGLAGAPLWAQAAPPTLRVLTHSSFDLPKELLAVFEKSAGVTLSIVKGGDAGEMLNKLILTRANPVADVVYGIDNALAGKALSAGVLAPYAGPAATAPSTVSLPAPLVPVDHGYVTLNIDKAWFAKSGLALPTSLQDLTLPAYKNLLVVQHPATSSPGLSFLAATIAGLGEEAAFDWWAKLRANGVKVAKGWSEAYYTDFSKSGGKRPIVVSYASSPAAEVFYSKTKLSDAPTASLSLKGAVFQQVEGVALVKGGQQAEAAGKFIEFLRSAPVQQALQTTMWMLPATPGVPAADVMRHAPTPTAFDNPSTDQMAAQTPAWVARWTQVVLK
jgi:thiamine transport system substrate-binding protein